jgi:hypothetical protein
MAAWPRSLSRPDIRAKNKNQSQHTSLISPFPSRLVSRQQRDGQAPCRPPSKQRAKQETLQPRQPVRPEKVDGRLAIDYSRAAATKRPRHADDEPEIVPTTAVVHLVDPHFGTEQTDKKRYRRDEPVPKAGPEAGGRCSWDLESRAWSRYRQDIGHSHLTTRRWVVDAYRVIVLHD